MNDPMNEDIINKIELKFNIHQNTIEKTNMIHSPLEVTPGIKINKGMICYSPTPCDQCQFFVNKVCFSGKKKP